MRKFAGIQDALDFAADNRDRLRFPFNCKCNHVILRVLSPDMARTLSLKGPSLVVSRTPSHVLELAYVVSVNALEKLVRSLSSSEGHYRLLYRDEQVTIAFYRNGKLAAEFKFPIAR